MNDSRTMVESTFKSVRFAVDPPEEEQDQNNWRIQLDFNGWLINPELQPGLELTKK